MKKSLVALAVLAATGAYAQSSVTLYGRMDLGSVGNETKTVSATGVNTTSKETQLAGAQNDWTGSRLGVRGSEDLGGGLKANFTYEFRIHPDNGITNPATGAAFTTNFGVTRTAILQVAGGFGSVTVGTYLNPFDDVRLSASNYGGPGGWTLDKKNGGLLNARSVNSIGYRTPVFGGGFTASLGTTLQKTETVTAGVVTAAAKTSGYIASVAYANGPIAAVVAAAQGNVTGISVPAANNGKVNDFGFRASYDLGVAKPYLSFENVKVSSNLVSADVRNRGFEIGSEFPLGAFTPYIVAADLKSTASTPVSSVTTNTRAYQLGSRYSISKRTFVYGSIGSSKDTTNSSSASSTLTGYSLGLVHNF